MPFFFVNTDVYRGDHHLALSRGQLIDGWVGEKATRSFLIAGQRTFSVLDGNNGFIIDMDDLTDIDAIFVNSGSDDLFFIPKTRHMYLLGDRLHLLALSWDTPVEHVVSLAALLHDLELQQPGIEIGDLFKRMNSIDGPDLLLTQENGTWKEVIYT